MELKSVVIGSAIAGLVAGILNLIVSSILGVAGLAGITEPIPMEDTSVGVFVVATMVTIILIGIIYGVIYTKLAPVIPGEARTKGVYYGLLIWIMMDIVAAMLMVSHVGAIYMAFGFVIGGLLVWPAYGFVLVMMLERIEGTE